MLYRILLLPARIALHFYCRKVTINRPELLKLKGPLIIAANHPNSFLDAIIFASIFKQPVFSLARGDAFVSGMVVRILHSLKILPVYRISEGAKNLKNNYDTFSKVHDLLKKDKIVLIFSEGRCINEWHLRPLKKGTARISLRAWQDGIPLKVLPAGINYSNFGHFGKHVIIHFGKVITGNTSGHDTNGRDIIKFNATLQKELSEAVYEIENDDVKTRKKIFGLSSAPWQKAILWLPATAGYILHFPLYFFIHLVISKRANAHYDSIMVGALFLGYPLYIAIAGLIILWLTGAWVLGFTALLMPFTAWALLHYRPVVEKRITGELR